VGQRFGRADILDTVTLPQPTRAAEGSDAGLGGDAGAGENDDIAKVAHDRRDADETRATIRITRRS
jgi:hypothetical protein